MLSEALALLDKNTAQYMIEEQQKEIEEKAREIVSLKQDNAEKDAEIARLRQQLAGHA